MPSRSALVVRRARDGDHPRGSLRFLMNRSASAVPIHPGEPIRCFCSLLHGWWQASPLSAGRPLSTSPNEAESGSLTLRLTPSHRQASTPELPPAAAASATRRTSNFHVQFLSTEAIHQTSLTHRKSGTAKRRRQRVVGIRCAYVHFSHFGFRCAIVRPASRAESTAGQASSGPHHPCWPPTTGRCSLLNWAARPPLVIGGGANWQA